MWLHLELINLALFLNKQRPVNEIFLLLCLCFLKTYEAVFLCFSHWLELNISPGNEMKGIRKIQREREGKGG